MNDIIGKKFGRLTIIKRIYNDKRGYSRWLCKCGCGKERIVFGHNLKNGNTKSCGCLQREISQKMGFGNIKHGHSQNNRTYRTWQHMKERCVNPHNKDYKDYGGRGITVCERWMKFENFLEDMGEHPSFGYSLDRIKNKLGYYKENCRWVTPKQQARNRHNNLYITHNGKTQLLIEWSEKTEIPASIIIWRLKHGWSTKKALTTPVGKQGRKNYEN